MDFKAIESLFFLKKELAVSKYSLIFFPTILEVYTKMRKNKFIDYIRRRWQLCQMNSFPKNEFPFTHIYEGKMQNASFLHKQSP